MADNKVHWRRWFVHGKLRFIGKPLYTSLIAAELATERALDALHPYRRPADHSLVAENLTAVIKTFERPKVLKRLIASIKRHYPELKIIVADDSRQPIKLDGVQVIALPYNSGISIGRTEGLKAVRTRYALILDDDLVFYRNTKLDAALALMEQNPQIDIMGGEQINLPLFEKLDYRRAPIFPTEASPTFPLGSQIGGLPVYDKVANFFIARSERVQIVGWDPALKIIEHADFFTRAKGILTTVFNINLKGLHAQTPFDRAYMRIRYNLAFDQAVLQMKHYKNR